MFSCFIAGLSYTLTGTVSIEMTKNVVRVKSLFMKGSALGVHTMCTFLFFLSTKIALPFNNKLLILTTNQNAPQYFQSSLYVLRQLEYS